MAFLPVEHAIRLVLLSNTCRTPLYRNMHTGKASTPVAQAVGVVDVRAPQPVGRHCEVRHNMVQRIAHGYGREPIILGHHLYQVLGGIVEFESQAPRGPYVEIHDRRPVGQIQHLADQPLKAAPALADAFVSLVSMR